MRAATAATLPLAIATSRTEVMLLRASTRWPPLRSRSYFCGADNWMVAAAANNTAIAVFMASASSILVPCRGPRGGKVLAHVERARHPVARDRAGEAEAQRVA